MSLAEFTPSKQEPDEFTLMEKLPLTFTQAQILLRIWRSVDKGTDNFNSYRSTRQHIYNMRPRLRPFGITILNLANRHYGMPRNSRQIMDKLLTGAS